MPFTNQMKRLQCSSATKRAEANTRQKHPLSRKANPYRLVQCDNADPARSSDGRVTPSPKVFIGREPDRMSLEADNLYTRVFEKFREPDSVRAETRLFRPAEEQLLSCPPASHVAPVR